MGSKTRMSGMPHVGAGPILAVVDYQGMAKSNDLIQGTLDLLILKVLSLEPLHGWAIAKRIEASSQDVLQVQQGSLYPALYRLEGQGWLKSHWGESPDGRKAKFYSLTAAGRKQFTRETDNWDRLSTAVGMVLKTL